MIQHEYTLSALLQIVQHGMQQLFGAFPFWCIAEISKCKVHNGRVYLDLIELDEGWNVAAQARAVVRQEATVREYCHTLWLWDMQKLVGSKVCMKVTCNFHPQYGFSLTVQEFSLAYAQWLEQQQRARAKEALIVQGIFEKNKTKKVWFPPLSIAVISSPSAEGLRDFLTILEQAKYTVDIKLYPATVHGNTAKDEILSAFAAIEQDMHLFDMICLVRWGWGKEWFVRFNDQDIAECVCNSSIPVITAIGHTVDQSLLDEVARYAAKTPSDAAHYIIGYVAAYEQSAQKWRAGIQQRMQLTARHLHERVQMRAHAIQELLQQRLVRSHQHIDQRYSTIRLADPRKQLNKWYALVKWNTQNRSHNHGTAGHYLSSTEIRELKKDDTLRIEVYDMSIDARVIGVHHEHTTDDTPT